MAHPCPPHIPQRPGLQGDKVQDRHPGRGGRQHPDEGPRAEEGMLCAERPPAAVTQGSEQTGVTGISSATQVCPAPKLLPVTHESTGFNPEDD